MEATTTGEAAAAAASTGAVVNQQRCVCVRVGVWASAGPSIDRRSTFDRFTTIPIVRTHARTHAGTALVLTTAAAAWGEQEEGQRQRQEPQQRPGWPAPHGFLLALCCAWCVVCMWIVA